MSEDGVEIVRVEWRRRGGLYTYDAVDDAVSRFTGTCMRYDEWLMSLLTSYCFDSIPIVVVVAGRYAFPAKISDF